MNEIIIVIYYLIEAYKWSLLAYILMGYFEQTRHSQIYEFFRGMCEPILHLFRFMTFNGISFAPILVFVILDQLQRLILGV
jgi:uncharacterized protein YggT (Ycf19 family)